MLENAPHNAIVVYYARYPFTADSTCTNHEQARCQLCLKAEQKQACLAKAVGAGVRSPPDALCSFKRGEERLHIQAIRCAGQRVLQRKREAPPLRVHAHNRSPHALIYGEGAAAGLPQGYLPAAPALHATEWLHMGLGRRNVQIAEGSELRLHLDTAQQEYSSASAAAQQNGFTVLAVGNKCRLSASTLNALIEGGVLLWLRH